MLESQSIDYQCSDMQKKLRIHELKSMISLLTQTGFGGRLEDGNRGEISFDETCGNDNWSMTYDEMDCMSVKSMSIDQSG